MEQSNKPEKHGDLGLSVVSKKWDVENKGYLTQEQTDLRMLDTAGDGTLTAAQLAPFLAQYKALREENKQVKRGLIALAILSILLFAGTVTVSVLASQANKVVEFNTGVMTSKDTGSPISTNTNEVNVPLGALAFIPPDFVSHIKTISMFDCSTGMSYHRSVSGMDINNQTSTAITTTAGDSFVWPSKDGEKQSTTLILNDGTSITKDATCSLCAATSVVMTDEVMRGVFSFFEHIGHDVDGEENDGGRKLLTKTWQKRKCLCSYSNILN